MSNYGLSYGTTGLVGSSAAMTNGQLMIGSSSGVPVAANLTQGSGISITDGAGSITIAATGGGSFAGVLAHKNAGDQTVGNGTEATITFDSTATPGYQTSSFGFDTGTSIYTCAATGYYHVEFHSRVAKSNGTDFVYLYQNSTLIAQFDIVPSGGSIASIQGSITISLSATDTVHITYVNNGSNSATIYNGIQNDYIAIYKIG